MKWCWKCDKEKKQSEFNKHSGRKDGLQTKCRLCSSKISKAYFKLVGYLRRNHTERRQDLASKVVEYLSKHPCVDCGETDPVVLEFDHVRGKKKANVSTLVSGRYGWATILKEIKKCEVVCACCHRRRTYKRGNHRKWLLSVDGCSSPALAIVVP